MIASRRLPPAHREAIREIFLKRQPEYSMREAASLLRLTLGETIVWVESGQLRIERRRKRKQLGGKRHQLVTWSELASAAMLRWTVMQIHDALGDEANRVLPRLLRPVELKSLRLPAYQVRLIEEFAREAGTSVEQYIYEQLLAVEAAGNADDMERLLPGFKEAMRFPDV